MLVWQFALLGAIGGFLVEVLSVFGSFATWQAARRTPTGKLKSNPPRLSVYIDVAAHTWIALFRSGLGAGAAALFGAGGQITGTFVSVALGFSAPSVLAQLGSIPQVAAAITGQSAPESE
ncbi:hypothetical protein [Streptomyces sp. NPDC057438]|uniref:hypothetical protein n=1 Tax=Streptomyces sp. NPDC057438 TaxID=3346133 RepID=UPI00368DF6E7